MKRKITFRELQLRRTEITIAIICVILSFSLVTQIRGQVDISSDLEHLKEQDLGGYIRDLNMKLDALRTEVTDLRIRLYSYEKEFASRKDILSEAARNLENLKVFTGEAKVKGPGVVIEIRDNKEILESYDLLDVIEELKGAGAEVIAVDEVRIVSRTAIAKKKDGLYVGNKKVKSPYILKAIGNTEVLCQGLLLPGGARDRLNSLEGISFEVQKVDEIVILPCQSSMVTKYAKPVEK